MLLPRPKLLLISAEFSRLSVSSAPARCHNHSSFYSADSVTRDSLSSSLAVSVECKKRVPKSISSRSLNIIVDEFHTYPGQNCLRRIRQHTAAGRDHFVRRRGDFTT